MASVELRLRASLARRRDRVSLRERGGERCNAGYVALFSQEFLGSLTGGELGAGMADSVSMVSVDEHG